MDLDVPLFCQQLVARCADAIVYADSEGVIRFWNSGAARILGIPTKRRWASRSI